MRDYLLRTLSRELTVMNSFVTFTNGLLEILDIDKPLDSLSISEQQQLISKINEYLFTSYEGIGTTRALDRDFVYISEFHKFWEKNHYKILNPKIDENKCAQVADVLPKDILTEKLRKHIFCRRDGERSGKAFPFRPIRNISRKMTIKIPRIMHRILNMEPGPDSFRLHKLQDSLRSRMPTIT